LHRACVPTEISLFCDATESALLASVFIAGTAQSSSAQTKARFDDFARAVHEQIPALKGAELVAEGQAAQLPRTLAQWGEPFLNYRAAGFDYRVDHGAFFQVNRFLVDALVERVTVGDKWFACMGSLCRRRPLRPAAYRELCPRRRRRVRPFRNPGARRKSQGHNRNRRSRRDARFSSPQPSTGE
jgi:hypothetical protein